jgi:hypothetical protein
LLTNALANWNEDNDSWKESIRNYESELRSRGSFCVNISREDCLRHHQIYNNSLSLMIRNFTFIFRGVIEYITCLWLGDGREHDISNKND